MTTTTNRTALLKVSAGLLLLLALLVGYWLLKEGGHLSLILDGDKLQRWIEGLGLWGPVMVVGLMMTAILISPIPSAPIALAAGAAYGHGWGTLYVAIGAELGAIGAFWIARLAGYELIRRWFGDRLETGWAGSQNMLMGIVFVSRLLPFVSFDLVSYAAGLTVLSFWRFALATFAGILPASFLLAHFGGEMATGETRRILVSVIALGALTLLPIAVGLVRKRLKR